MKVIVSAPGKIHLMGEHAVVYGFPALLTAVNRRLVVTVEKSIDASSRSLKNPKLVEEALRIVSREYEISDTKNISIQISSSIPAGRHLGSSAAVSVATVGALLYYFKKIWNPARINQLAYEVEKVQHGTPSGGDNSICTYGGYIWFRKEVEFLKTIWQVPLKMPNHFAPFHLVDTGKPVETTGEMIVRVRSFISVHSVRAQALFNQNEQATKDIAVAFKTGDEKMFIAALRYGEQTLEKLGVVSKKIIPLIRSIEKSGGAAKILGGGGYAGPVGYLLAYHHDRSILDNLVKNDNYTIETIRLGEEGIRLESGKS